MPRPPNAIRSHRLSKTPPWTQAELGARFGYSQTNISAWERGAVIPDLARALLIAGALGQPVEAVFYGLFEQACHEVGTHISMAQDDQAAPG